MKKIISNLLIIFIIIFLLNICYSKVILKDSLIKIFGKAFVIVTTGSMEPEIEAGELVIISEENQYYKGDIITYVDDENFLVTHRIVNIDENNFVAKGDSNNINDDENLNSNIKGKVIYHSKLLGSFVLYFLKPIVVIYIVIFIGINIYFYVIKKNVKDDMQSKNAEEKLKVQECSKKEEENNEKK